MSTLIPSTTPLREFKGHRKGVIAVAVFPDKRRMITGSWDKTLCLWDLEKGVVLKTMQGHYSGVMRLAISRDGQLIASGDADGQVIVWNGETGESITPLTRDIDDSNWIYSLDFSPDGKVLATGSWNKTMKLWCTETWQMLGNEIECGGDVLCIRYSPSGKFLAIATSSIEIYDSSTGERVASFKGHTSHNLSLAWTPDGTRLLTGGSTGDPTIREWNTLTWQQVGDPWTGHTSNINVIAIHPAGTLIASASDDQHVRLWRLSDRRTVATFKHSSLPECVTFSVGGKYILSGGGDKMISEWAVPQGIHPKILAITTARNACINGDLSTAEELLTQDINTNVDNHTSYAHRSFVMARQHHWNHALQDAIKSISIQPSLIGYICKGIALCGTGDIRDARAALDVAFMYTNEDPETIHFLLLIKVIALFNANRHAEANLLLKEFTIGCPNTDTLACSVVEGYLCVELGTKALDGKSHSDAAEHFTAAINSGAFSSKFIDEIYEDLIVLFGWDLKSLWLTAHQKRCDALFQAGRLQDAVKSYRYMMDTSDDITKANCLDWSNAFARKCSTLCLTDGIAALNASNYDGAIDLCSAVIDLDSKSDDAFENRSQAKLGKLLWEDALLDAQKYTQLNPSSYVGYQLTHAALRGAQRYDEAIRAFTIMLSKMDNASEAQTRDLRQQYVLPSEAEKAIQEAIWTEFRHVPPRLLNTRTGLLCDREAQINSFTTSSEYNELISFPTKEPSVRTERIKGVVSTYFRCVLLSHRWEKTEALLPDIHDKVVYELNELGGITKLQSFCRIARDAGYHWAWMDTCCIDKRSNNEVQESVNSMFVWYRHSALTIVYLCDVPPSSQSGALAKSVWNERGWTFQEFLASKVVIFYQKDWSLYLNDPSPNHKESRTIMKELKDATGMDARALISFHPGTNDVRRRLQWASSRVTTLQEDIAYSLFGIFDIQLPVIYGEKQKALGRLLQEIVAQSGDITALDWIGQPSEFNSCLPADITSYRTPPRTLPPLSEDQIQTTISSLRTNFTAVDLASKLYSQLNNTSAASFANRRLHLPCITFCVTSVSLRNGLSQETRYDVEANGLRDLVITTKKPIVGFSGTRLTDQTFVLVRPWDRSLLELPNLADLPDVEDDTESEGDYWTAPSSPVAVDLESRALRLFVRLRQPFSAFLLVQLHGKEYKRVASDHNIIAQVVEDVTSVQDLMDIRMIEIW